MPSNKILPLQPKAQTPFFFCFQSKILPLALSHKWDSDKEGVICESSAFQYPLFFFFFLLRNSSTPGYNDQLTLLSCNLRPLLYNTSTVFCFKPDTHGPVSLGGRQCAFPRHQGSMYTYICVYIYI